MATEVVFLQASVDTITDDFRTVLNEAQAVQDAWVEKTFPGQIKPAQKWQEVERPNRLLITQTWPETSQQRAWGASDEGKGGHVKVMAYIAFEDQKPRAEKFHVEGEIFRDSGNSNQTQQLLDSPVISVGRHLVASDKKDAFMAKFDYVKGALEDYAKPYVARGGWRIEKENDSTEEWLLFVGWLNVEAHKDFAQSPGFTRYRHASNFITGFDVRHYKRMQ